MLLCSKLYNHFVLLLPCRRHIGIVASFIQCDALCSHSDSKTRMVKVCVVEAKNKGNIIRKSRATGDQEKSVLVGVIHAVSCGMLQQNSRRVSAWS